MKIQTSFFKISIFSLILLLILSLLYFFSKDTKTENIIFVKHGTSFGMCSGYCYNEKTIFKTKTFISNKMWGKSIRENLPEKKDSILTNFTKWNQLIKNVNLDEFYQLPEVLGCPDCADGGMEWLEIKTDKKTYKVIIQCQNKRDSKNS